MSDDIPRYTYDDIMAGSWKYRLTEFVDAVDHVAEINERFWAQVDKSGECWEWTGPLFTTGYGSFYIGKVRWRSHRYSALLYYGPYEQNVIVCHTCDNRKCVRPDHLVLADHDWNAKDREAKGRGAGRRKTHCPNGHEYTDENTLYTKKGHRKCRECNKQDCRKYVRKAG